MAYIKYNFSMVPITAFAFTAIKKNYLKHIKQDNATSTKKTGI